MNTPLTPLRAARWIQFVTLAAFNVFALMPACLWANPVLDQVVSGDVTLQTNGSTLTVTNSDGSIIHWSDFSIAGGETTHFQQNSAASSVLNRVTGSNLSAIYGTLSSNGQVVLINPNGIVIGAGGIVDCAGFTASTLNITNEQFQVGGTLKFMSQGETGTITNLGKISASHGDVILISKQIVNRGEITAPQGTAGLYASDEVYLAESGENRGMVRLTSSTAQLSAGIENSGTIEAARAELKATGNIYALAINNTGTVRATGTQKINGVVHFSGKGGTVQNAGQIVATNGQHGGKVLIEADRIKLTSSSLIDVRGAVDGGEALIGGDYQGKNTEVHNAKRVWVEQGAKILADGGSNHSTLNTQHSNAKGNGGKVIVWSDEITGFYGEISARGGVQGGNGGFVEVSGKAYLDYNGVVDTRAPQGQKGTLLLDPTDITIYPAADSNITSVSPFEATSTSGSSLLNTATLITQLGLSNVIVQTGGTYNGINAGNINISGSVIWSSGYSLTLNADNEINVGSPMSNGGTGDIIFNAKTNITISSNVTTFGSVILNADADANGSGIVTLSSNVSAGGMVTVRGDDYVNSDIGNFGISGGTGIVFETSTVGKNITVSGNNPLDFSLGAGELASTGVMGSPGIYTPSITIGRADGTGIITVVSDTTITSGATVSLRSPGGTVNYQGNVTATGPNNNLSVEANEINLNGYNIDAGSNQVTVISNGNITGFGQITAGTINISGAGNIGVNTSQRINLAVDNLVLNKSGGDSYIGNNASIRVSGVAGDNFDLVTVAGGITVEEDLTANGDISLTAGDAIVLMANVQAGGGGGNVFLSSLYDSIYHVDGIITANSVSLIAHNYMATGNTGQSIVQTGGAIIANYLTAESGGEIVLYGDNQVAVLGGLTGYGDVGFYNAGDGLIVDGVIESVEGDVTISTVGDFTFGSEAQVSANSAVVGTLDGYFINDRGADVFTPSTQWTVISYDNSGDFEDGGLKSDYELSGLSLLNFLTGSKPNLPSGNGFIFTKALFDAGILAAISSSVNADTIDFATEGAAEDAASSVKDGDSFLSESSDGKSDDSDKDDDEVKPGETSSYGEGGGAAPASLDKAMSGEVKESLSEAMGGDEESTETATTDTSTQTGGDSSGGPAKDDASVPAGETVSIGLDGQLGGGGPPPPALNNSMTPAVRGFLAGAL